MPDRDNAVAYLTARPREWAFKPGEPWQLAELRQGGIEQPPPVPEGLARTFKSRGRSRILASRPLRGRETSPYALFRFLEPGDLRRRRGDFVLLGVDGHGVNCWFLHYILIKQPLRIFLQLSWGGAYDDPATDAAKANECFRAAAELLKLTEANPVPVEVLASDTGESSWRTGDGKWKKAGSPLVAFIGVLRGIEPKPEGSHGR